MSDTIRTLSALKALLADNTEGNISAQDMRDFLVSVFNFVNDADPAAGVTGGFNVTLSGGAFDTDVGYKVGAVEVISSVKKGTFAALKMATGAGANKVLTSDATGEATWQSASAPGAHKTTHQNTGGDEINVAALSGELADEQKSAFSKISGVASSAQIPTEIAHGFKVTSGFFNVTAGLKVNDVMRISGVGKAVLTGFKMADGSEANTKVLTCYDASGNATWVDPGTPGAHASEHENDGVDEISVAALSGELADEQKSNFTKITGVAVSAQIPAGITHDFVLTGGDFGTDQNYRLGGVVVLDSSKQAFLSALKLVTGNQGAGKVLRCDAGGLGWADWADPAAPGAHHTEHETGGSDVLSLALNFLSNVVISGTPADNEVLAYDSGGNWINQTAAEVGLCLVSAFNDHSARHENAGADRVSLDASQVGSGILSTARGGTGKSGQTALRALVTSAGGLIVSSPITSDELERLDGVSSNIQYQLDGKAASSHNHSGTDITTGLVAAARMAAHTPASHNHTGENITSGTVALARIPTMDSGHIPTTIAHNFQLTGGKFMTDTGFEMGGGFVINGSKDFVGGNCNLPTGKVYKIDGVQVLRTRRSAIADPNTSDLTIHVAVENAADLEDVRDLENKHKALALKVKQMLDEVCRPTSGMGFIQT